MLNQLLCHLAGDYALQSSWMANNKTKRWLPAMAHACAYFIPFTLLHPSFAAAAVIVGTHAIIDHLRLARYVAYAGHFLSPRGEWRTWADCAATGYHKDTPQFLAVWLMIIVDNTLHLCINAFALAYL